MDLPDKLKNYNLYHLLDVETFSDTRKIKKGYRNLALKYHPDRFPTDKDSALKFELGTVAYKFLLNMESRFSYDQMLRNRARKILNFENRAFTLPRHKISKGFYAQRGAFDGDYHRFVDECRSGFQGFLKTIPRVWKSRL